MARLSGALVSGFVLISVIAEDSVDDIVNDIVNDIVDDDVNN